MQHRHSKRAWIFWSCLPGNYRNDEERRRAKTKSHGSYEIQGLINFSYPLDENGVAVAVLTVPHLERIGNRPNHEAVHHSVAVAANKLLLKLGGDVAQSGTRSR